MSNIRPIADPAIANAMLATMQSIDAARTAPSGISAPRWRILLCIAKCAPNVPNMGELRLCSGLNKAALAEHLQALRRKGLIGLDSLQLSASAIAMIDQYDASVLSSQPAVQNDSRARSRTLARKPAAPSALLSSDVPACIRPDCQPAERSAESKPTVARSMATPHAMPRAAAVPAVSTAPTTVAITDPVPSRPSWIEERAARISAAIAYLKSHAILCTTIDREAPVRTYRVSGKRYPMYAEEVVELAIEKGWRE